MKSKYKNYLKSGFSNFSNFSKIISREIREKYYFEFLEKFSRRTQSNKAMSPTLQNNDVWRQKNVLSADNCSLLHSSAFLVLNRHFVIFWTDILSKAGHSTASEWAQLQYSQYKCSVSNASQRTFGLSNGALFASNDSKTSFELRKQWPLNRQLRRFFEDKYLTSAVNFPTTAVKFLCLFKRQICRWHGQCPNKNFCGKIKNVFSLSGHNTFFLSK
jgi:hypothetical protein